MAIEFIQKDDMILAIIIPYNYVADGLSFITPESFSQQLAYMRHPEGKVIQPHIHKPLKREVNFTQEVLVIKRGKIRVDFYTPEKDYLTSRILVSGDTILLASAGHGFEVIEEVEMIEIKQGPYGGDDVDKIRFKSVSPEKISIK